MNKAKTTIELAKECGANIALCCRYKDRGVYPCKPDIFELTYEVVEVE